MNTFPELAAYVRLHMDLDSNELPDALLSAWATEGSSRIWQRIRRSPFYEGSWTLVTNPGQRDYPFDSLSTDLDSVASIAGERRVLSELAVSLGDRRFGLGVTSGASPQFYGSWQRVLRLYPTPVSVETFEVRGHRKMHDWVASGAEPDLPVELHNAVRVWMLGQAYLQQEDPELSITHLDLFEDEVTKASQGSNLAAVPLVIGGSGRRGDSYQGRLVYPFE